MGFAEFNSLLEETQAKQFQQLSEQLSGRKNSGEVSAGVEAKTKLQSMFLKDRVRHTSGMHHSY